MDSDDTVWGDGHNYKGGVPLQVRHARKRMWMFGRTTQAPRWCVWWVADDRTNSRIASTRDAMPTATPSAYGNLRGGVAMLIAGALRDAQDDASVALGTYLPGRTLEHARQQQARL
jgi:hypothetical protein